MSRIGRKGLSQRKRKICKDDEADEDVSPIIKVFQKYQVELDAKHDKYERLVKKSRDLTIESKRIIFLLHRASSSEDKDEILLEAENRLYKLLVGVINEIALELTKQEVYQFLRSISPGLQEYVEAVSFYNYLKNGNIVHIEEVCNLHFIHKDVEIPEKINEGKDYVKADLPISAFLTPVDFILGIADLTGELMRKCINSVANGDIEEEPFKLCCVLQNIYDAFLKNCNNSRELRRKLFTLKCSVEKVENACYAIRIRGKEIPKHMLADFFSSEEENKECAVDCDL